MPIYFSIEETKSKAENLVVLNNASPALVARLPIKLPITTHFMAAFCFKPRRMIKLNDERIKLCRFLQNDN